MRLRILPSRSSGGRPPTRQYEIRPDHLGFLFPVYPGTRLCGHHAGGLQSTNIQGKSAHHELHQKPLSHSLALSLTRSLCVCVLQISLVSMGNYAFFLGQLTTLSYVLVYGSFLYTRVKLGKITPAMLAYPRRSLWACGALDAIGLLLGIIGASKLPGVILPLIGQTTLVWQVLLSRFYLRKRLTFPQVLGVLTVIMGVVVAVWPRSDSLAQGAHQFANIDLTALVLATISMAPPSITSVLKERLFARSEKDMGSKLDLFVVNTTASIAQTLSVLFLLPALAWAAGIDLPGLPGYLVAGGACFLGNSSGGLADCSSAPMAPLAYIAINLCFNLAILSLLRRSGALVTSLCIAAIVPITVFAFTQPLPVLGPAPPVGPNFNCGVVLLLTGVSLYNSAQWSRFLYKKIGNFSPGWLKAALRWSIERTRGAMRKKNIGEDSVDLDAEVELVPNDVY